MGWVMVAVRPVSTVEEIDATDHCGMLQPAPRVVARSARSARRAPFGAFPRSSVWRVEADRTFVDALSVEVGRCDAPT